METKIYQTAKEFFKYLNNYEADILGAINANIDTVFYNPDNIPANIEKYSSKIFWAK